MCCSLTDSEPTRRVQHIVNALNTVLVAYSGQRLADMPHKQGKDNLIFAVNEYNHPYLGTNAITAATTTVETLSRMLPTPRRGARLSTEYWALRLKSGLCKGETTTFSLQWEDVLQCWDVTSTKGVACIDFPSFSSTSFLGRGRSSKYSICARCTDSTLMF